MSDSTLYESEALAVPRQERASVREVGPRQAMPSTAGPRLHRKRRTSDPFYIDKREIPAGFSYEWKAESIYGQPNTDHMIGLRENHWRAVPASRHPHLAPAGETTIRRAGTILMERPQYLTDEARMEDIQEAMKPVQQKEELIYGRPGDEFPRTKGSRINQTFAPGEPGDGIYSEP